jgi:predicted SprT family Zn-dependent metalloprotease
MIIDKPKPMLELTEELEETKNSQQVSKTSSQLKRPVKTSESYMMLKEDLSLNPSLLKKLNSNCAELKED